MPIIPKGTKNEVIAACLFKSTLWSNIKLYNLTFNYRCIEPVNYSDEERTKHRDFIEFQNAVGRGDIPNNLTIGPNSIRIPDEYILDGDN